MTKSVGNPHTKAVHMASNHITEVIKAIGEHGNFMERNVGAKAQATKDRISQSPDAQALLDQGFTQSYADRVAKAVGK